MVTDLSESKGTRQAPPDDTTAVYSYGVSLKSRNQYSWWAMQLNFESDPLSTGSDMNAADDFRFKSHELLLDLDAAVNKMMMMVSARELSGERWSAAVTRHSDAYAAWSLHLNESSLPKPYVL